MNSATQSQPPQLQQPEIPTKKKFGKNLNKLARPPPQAPNNNNAKSNPNSRNGLLLLSTKRPSSGTHAASSAGGILASKSSSAASGTAALNRPLPLLGLQNKSSTSTHDALLGAVVGAFRAESQEPDAWGVAEKQKSPMHEEAHSKDTLAQGNDDLKDLSSSTSNLEPEPNRNSGEHSSETHQTEFPGSSWDEYGGRDLTSNGNQSLYSPRSEGLEDKQKSAMIRLARERAEKVRAEEEARQVEQRERATLKLRELEEKMVVVAPEKTVAPDDLGPTTTGSRDQAIKPRTLYDPNEPSNMSYSASAGGSTDIATGAQAGANLHKGTAPNGIYSPEAQANGSRDFAYSRQPVIQLSSYDDRDRGERAASAAPRMLFDPKSGSMVAVPSRDDSAAGGRAAKKERGKKTKIPREKESKTDPRQEDEGKGPRKGKQKKTIETLLLTRLETKRGKLLSERKLPRTCGVLYSPDNKGSFTCSDGCEGDLGYGAHSVPGGRIKNTDAYTKYMNRNQRTNQGESSAYSALDTSFENDMNQNMANEEIRLQTGFSVPAAANVTFDWVKRSDKIELITGAEDSPTLQATAKEWAPSQAALAAATARFERGIDNGKIMSCTSSDAEDDDDDDGPFGLGFDPTLNMDSMMHSPSAEPAHVLAAVDLTSLSLEPAYQGSAKTNHIFAFGAGSTWGASDAGGNSDTWGAPSSSSDATTFLSLSSGKTWGGISAFGGALGSASLNGDHPRSAGD